MKFVIPERGLLGLNSLSMNYQSNDVKSVVFSVPHDGMNPTDFIGMFRSRKYGVFERDVFVWPLVNQIISTFNACAVRGLAPRLYIDYNRAWPTGIKYPPVTDEPAQTALDDERLVPFYNYYHACVSESVIESIEKFGKENVLLLDMHGFAFQPSYAPDGGYDVILGTGNRETIHYGDVDLDLGEFLLAKGYKVFIPQKKNVGHNEDLYSADFITRHYAEKYQVNAVQIEIARRFRNRNAPEDWKHLAETIADFLKLRESRIIKL